MKYVLGLLLLITSVLGGPVSTLNAESYCSYTPHGGQYRGPGDVVPPNGGGGRVPGPTTPGPVTPGPSTPGTRGPSGPTTPGSTPGGPTTGGPAAPGPGSGPRTPRGIYIGNDLTKWQFWWEFNKDPYINLKESIHSAETITGSDEFFMGSSRRVSAKDTLKPSESEILNKVLPALKRAIDSTDQRDIVSSCLIAMAKIGKNHRTFNILDLMRDRLVSRDQEIRETAALAMGISHLEEALEYLPELAMNTLKGRKLVRNHEVDNRTRAFSCYGIGLIAHSTDSSDVKRRCYEVLSAVLEKSTRGGVVDRNIPVAAINSIRLIRPNPQGGEKDAKLLGDCIETLFTYYSKKVGQGEQMIQSHVPPAIAQLLGRGGDPDDKFKSVFAKELVTPGRARTMYQSAAIALGILVHAPEKVKSDKKYSDKLLSYFKTGKDPQTRNFALMSLGKIGGNHNRNQLLIAFKRGTKAIVKPWAAISLGVLAFNQDEGSRVDSTIGIALHKALTDIKNDETKSAIAIALGLCKFQDAATDIGSFLVKYRQRDELAGYLCISLALMNDTRSIETIRGIVKMSIRRPELLQQAAVALGKLGDKSVTHELQEMLKSDTNKNVAKLSAIASALGYIGDRRTIIPLVNMLHDESITPLSRAFAAVALGGVADKEKLPWNSKIAVDMNYRASVETLTNQVTGILDIL